MSTTLSDRRIVSLDLLRGLAAYAVALPHFLTYAYFDIPVLSAIAIGAVDIFFALSGFVLAGQIMVCAQSGKWSYYGHFLVRRWMRTVPPYLIALTLIAILTGNAFGADYGLFALFIQNLFSQHMNNDFFPIAWSLSVEEWFYLTFPLLLFISAWYLRTCTARFLIGFFAVFLTIKIIGIWLADDIGSEIRRVVLYRLDAIGFGFVLFLYRDRIASVIDVKGVAVIALASLAATVGSLLALLSGNQNPLTALAYFYAAPLFACSCLLMFLTAESWMARKQRLANICLVAGRLSYPVYLFHLLFMYVVVEKLPGEPVLVTLPTFAIVLTIFCYYFNRYFEQPILAARPPLRPRKIRPV